MEKVILHLGSNKGERAYHLSRAKAMITKAIGRVVLSSGMYETEAWGVEDQPDFINQVLIVDSMLSPDSLIQTVKKIETVIGKEKEYHWGPRYIDIDVLFYGNQIIESESLSVPHPHMQDRNFVLVPLNEVCPDFYHPTLHKSVSQLMKECKDQLSVELLNTEKPVE